MTLRLRVRLGGLLQLIGWMLLAIGGFLSAIFVGNSELMTAWRFSGELATTRGAVVAVERTDVRVNNQTAFEVTFGYRAMGQDHRAAAFSIGRAPEPGGEVTVEYVVADPATARIQGMQTAAFPVWVAFVLLFPAVGAALVAFSMLRRGRQLALMRDGQAAWGLLTGRRATKGRVNNAVVYELEFTFVDGQGQQQQATAHSHRSEFLRNDIARAVLHDPNGGRSCLVDLIPGQPRTEADRWLPPSPFGLLRVLLAPAFAALMISLGLQFQL